MKNEKHDFGAIGSRFVSSVRSLRIFSDRIGAVAAEHDRSATDSFFKTLDALLPGAFPLDQEEVADSSASVAEPSEDTDSGADEEILKARAKEFLDDPEKWKELKRAMKSLLKAAPVQAQLLRTSVLISLMIYLEALVADLVHAFYARFPQALSPGDRTLSLADLREIGSIEEAEAFLVAKEVDSVLRESLDSQLEYFAKRLKVDLGALSEYAPIAVEIDQRRNLFVHNRGVVNRVYLQRVDPKVAEAYEATRGEELPVKEDYLTRSMNIVEVAGVVLRSQCWRKWDKESTETADRFLLDTTFEGLLEENYELVERIAGYGTTVSFQNDFCARAVCVNQAIALRDSGRSDEIENVLKRYDWSACSLDFRVALSVLRDHTDELYNQLPRAVAAGEIDRDNLQEWPLFRTLRGTDEFSQTIERIFPGT